MVWEPERAGPMDHMDHKGQLMAPGPPGPRVESLSVIVDLWQLIGAIVTGHLTFPMILVVMILPPEILRTRLVRSD